HAFTPRRAGSGHGGSSGARCPSRPAASASRSWSGHSESCRQAFWYQPFSSPNLVTLCASAQSLKQGFGTNLRQSEFLAAIPGLVVVVHPVSNQDLAARQERFARRAREQRSMYHI